MDRAINTQLTFGWWLIKNKSACVVSECARACASALTCSFSPPPPVQEKLEQSPKRDIEGMGVAEIKYGDSLCFIMHVATGLWLSYQAPDVKSARLGPLKRRVSRDTAHTVPSPDAKHTQKQTKLINKRDSLERVIILRVMS